MLSAAAPAAALLARLRSGGLPTAALLVSLVPPLAYAVMCLLEWRSRVWAYRRVLTCCEGVIDSRAAVLSRSDVSRIELRRSVLLGLAKAVRMDIAERSVGGARRLVLGRQEGIRLSRQLAGCPEQKRQAQYTATLGASALEALAGSNFASGLLVIIPAAMRLGKIAGSELDRRLYEELGSTAAQLMPGLPSLHALAAGLLALGYAVHFVSNFLACARHTAYSSDGCTVISAGVPNRRVCIIPPGAVSVVETRRTLLMCALSCSSCHIRTDAARGSVCLIMPHKSRSFTHIRAAFFPRPDYTGAVVRPDRAHLRLYSQKWYVMSMVCAVLWAVCDRRSQLVSAAAMICSVMLMWRALAGRCASRTAKVRVCPGFVELSSVGGFTVRTWRVDRQSIARITLRRTPFDMLRGTCTAVIGVSGMRGTAKCPYLPYERVLALCERLAQ